MLNSIFNKWNQKKYFSFSSKLLFSSAILILLLRKLDLNKISDLIAGINIYYTCGAVLLILILRAIMAIRWKIILRVKEITVPLSELIYITYVSSSIGLVFPGSIGADLIRGYHLNKKNKDLVGIASTILVDRCIGIYSMFLVAFIGSIIARMIDVSIDGFWILFLINMLFVAGWGILFLLRDQLSKIPIKAIKLKELLLSVTNYEDLKRIFWRSLLLSFGVQILRCVVFYLLYVAFGHSIPFIYFLIFIPMVYVAIFIPLSIGGLGIREGALVLFFQIVNVVPEVSMSVGILSHALHIAAAIPGVLMCFSWGGSFRAGERELDKLNQDSLQ